MGARPQSGGWLEVGLKSHAGAGVVVGWFYSPQGPCVFFSPSWVGVWEGFVCQGKSVGSPLVCSPVPVPQRCPWLPLRDLC